MKYGIEQQLQERDADLAQRFHVAMLRRLHQLQAGASPDPGSVVDGAIALMRCWDDSAQPAPSRPWPPPMADQVYGCAEHYYGGCPNCGRRA